jgi:hypothetical protein
MEGKEEELIIPIVNSHEIETARGLLQGMVDLAGNIQRTWLEENGFLAVPVESGEHFNEADIQHISQALSAEKYTDC